MRASALTAVVLASLASISLAVVSVVPLSLENSKLDPIADRSSRNIAYYGQFKLGTHSFLGCFDTGSSDVWVPSTACTSQVCRTKERFSGSGSNAVVSEEPFRIVYGTGEVAGVIAADSLSIGTPNLTLDQQVFGDALDLSVDFISTSCDGLFGLAFPALSELGQLNPFFNAVSQGLLDAPQFSLYLNPNTTAVNAGQLILGGNDSSLYQGSLKNYSVLSPSYWVIAFNGSAVGTEEVTLEAQAAIIDSGTTGIVLSDADAGNISAAIPRLAYWPEMDVWNVTGDCNDLSDLPDITFILGNDSYPIPPSQWVQEISDNIDSSFTCISSIQGGGSSDAAVLGTTFLRTYYASFSLTEQANGSVTAATISLAPSINGTRAGTSTGNVAVPVSGPATASELQKPKHSL